MDPICINNLSKTYIGKRLRKVQALTDLSLIVKRGEVFGFLGPNGAGKSTTIKILMGMMRPTTGQTMICGKTSKDASSRQSVGYLPENPAFYDFLTGQEYMELVASVFGLSKREAKVPIEKWLERMNLTAAVSRPIRSYSKGMVQRLGLAQALFHDPDVVILDEPMSGLDPNGRALVKEVILDLRNAGKTVFFSTHITADVEKICDRLAIVVGGKLRVIKAVDEVMRHGVTGYRLQARGHNLAVVAEARPTPGRSDEFEFVVKTTELSSVISQIAASGGTVEAVEPLRKDLEEYFLEIVRQATL